MGHLCSKGISGNANAIAIHGNRGGGSATPNSHHLPNTPASPPPQPAGNVSPPALSNQSTPTNSLPLPTSPWENAYPPGIAPSPSPAGTPRRRFRWPFPPPSPAKPMMSALLRRLGAAPSSSSQPPIPREEGGRTTLDKTFGYANNFSSLFEVGKELGRGHFGHTCRAKGLRGELKNQAVAVKIISKAQMTTALAIEDVLREVKILRALSRHQNLIQFYNAFEDEQHVFIVMELCEGGELLDRVLTRGGRYMEEDAKRIVVQILNVVAHMHLQGVVHRDLKPENFLFAKGNEDAPMKVIDFGLSDFIHPDECLNDVVGSAFYVAPEVLHRSYSVGADMWSVGVITYILLCGTRPFWGRTESGIFRSVLHMEPNFQDGPWRNISIDAKDFVRRLLIKDHRKRMTAAQALTHPWLSSQNPAIPLDIFIFKLVKSYVRFGPLRRASLQALSMTLTEQELVYLRAQFQLLEPIDGYISLENFRTALLKNMSDAMRESRVPDILDRMSQMPHEEMDFGEFCAAAISPLQLEALENWEEMVTTAYGYFEQWNREITIEEIAEEENLGRLIPSIVRQWVRSDRKLSFYGYTKILHGTSTVDDFGARHRRKAAESRVTAASTSGAASTSSGT